MDTVLDPVGAPKSILYKRIAGLCLIWLFSQLTACAFLPAETEPVRKPLDTAEAVPVKAPPAKEKAKKPVEPPPPVDETVATPDPWEKHEETVKANNQAPSVSNSQLSLLRSKLDIRNRMSLDNVEGTTPLDVASRKFSFKAQDTDLQDGLREFAKQHKLNVFIDEDVDGVMSVDFKGLALNKAMELMLGPQKYYWTWRDDLIRISRLQTKSFTLDYLRLVRTGQGSNSSSIATNSSTSGSERSSSSIQQNDNIAVWDELETQIAILISDQGRFVINRLSGTIHVTDVPTRIAQIADFLDSLKNALHRQVEIDARIMEVTLRDDKALGIDWSQISVKGITGSFNTIIGNAGSETNQGIDLKTSTLQLAYDHDNFNTLISALEEQGNVQVVSQPRIRTMNNQPSLIKVGTDRTFFTQTANRTTTVTGQTDFIITEEPNTVTEGLVLSLTPQISKDRWVMMDISPILTRVVDVTTSPQGSTAPVLEVKQASTLIRAKDGEMIILGGLIQEDSLETQRQVPLFSRLPFIGRLFEGDYSTKVKKELIIFLVPRLVI